MTKYLDDVSRFRVCVFVVLVFCNQQQVNRFDIWQDQACSWHVTHISHWWLFIYWLTILFLCKQAWHSFPLNSCKSIKNQGLFNFIFSFPISNNAVIRQQTVGPWESQGYICSMCCCIPVSNTHSKQHRGLLCCIFIWQSFMISLLGLPQLFLRDWALVQYRARGKQC